MLSILTELLSHISFLQSQYAVLGREGLDVVVRGGERVVGAEVEAALGALPGVRDAAVVGEAHEVRGAVIVGGQEVERCKGGTQSHHASSRCIIHTSPLAMVVALQLIPTPISHLTH